MRSITPRLSSLLLSTAILGTLTTGLQAAPVSADEALQAATGLGRTRLAGAEPLSIREAGAPGVGELWWVQFQPEGWALLSGDDAGAPVLGYSRRGWLADSQPDALRDWTTGLADQVRAIRERSSVEHAGWAELYAAARGPVVSQLRTGEDVDPLLDSQWNQSAGWNAECPEDPAGPGDRCFAGCVATALAQVLYYYNWPVSGTGAVSYVLADYGSISVDFATASYDFASMANTGVTPATAHLLYHAGVAVRMNYGPDVSTASTSNIPGALRNYLRYSNAAVLVWRQSYDAAAWTGVLRDELENGRPIVYRGSGTGGHAFCLDGVDSADLFHVNWGWGGSYDGWYALDGLEPGGYDFNSMQAAVIGIHPNDEWNAPNSAPVAVDMDVEIDEDAPLELTLQASDADGDDLSYEVDGEPVLHGVWSWTPEPDFNGEVSFQWRAFDGVAWSGPAQIVVTVDPVNDAPVAPLIEASCLEDSELTLTLVASDPDDDALSYEVDGVVLDGADWSWSPDAGFNGEASFVWRAYDGQSWSTPSQIDVTVQPVNDAPVVENVQVTLLEDATLSLPLSGTDPDGDAFYFLVDGIFCPGGVFNWTPPANFNGVREFVLMITDGQLVDSATLTVTVEAVNDAPIAIDHEVIAGDQGEVTVKLDGLDVDGDEIVFFVEGASISGNRVTVGVPTEIDGSTVVEYQAFDGVLLSEPARIVVSHKLAVSENEGPCKPEGAPGDAGSDIELDGAIAEAETALLPESAMLRPNYPNPFNPSTTLVVALPAEMQAKLSVYNLTGARVAVLHDGPLSAGEHRIQWQAGTLASGMYLAVLETAEGRDVRRMTLVR